MPTLVHPHDGIAALRRFVRAMPVDLCELCGTPLPDRHGHVVEPATRRVLCACLICGEAVSNRPDRRYCRVPEKAEALPDFRIGDPEWHSLGLPIDMAFIFYGTPEGGPVAVYPGPLGATESPVRAEAWAALLADNPVLREFEPDVEALLVNRLRGARACYRVPIDRCYSLVGVIRSHWQGFSGGDTVWQAIDDFLAGLASTRPTARGGGR